MSDSDIEIRKIAPLKPVKKPPQSPTEDLLKIRERKLTTKKMIHEALTELKTRKGVSSYAIKKYLEEKYQVETEKVKYLIKKTLKSGVEDGSIIQLKGIGASGSFKLAAVKEKVKKVPKKKKEKVPKEKASQVKAAKEKPVKEKIVKDNKIPKEKLMKAEKKKVQKDKTVKEKKVQKTERPKLEKEGKGKSKDVKERMKGSKGASTPAKKKATMMKRKSIGSIIKPPKMKPKSKS